MTTNGESSKTGARQTADYIRALRIGIWREWEKLWSEAMDPRFTGTISLEVRVKEGIPTCEPRFTCVKCGVTE